MRVPALLLVAAGLVTGACGDGGATATLDAAPADVAADAPRDSTAQQDAVADLVTDATADQIPANFVAIAPCPDPTAYAAATQVSTSVDNRYTPACVRVAAGGAVTFEASVAHPLEARAGGSVGNPIPTQSDPATVAFPTPGFFPFLCPEHVDQGMIGVVWVE